MLGASCTTGTAADDREPAAAAAVTTTAPESIEPTPATLPVETEPTLVLDSRETVNQAAPEPEPEPVERAPLITMPPNPLPSVEDPFVAPGSEPYAEAKTLAGQIAQRLLTYDPDTLPFLLAADVARETYQVPELAGALEPAFHSGYWSRAEVIYPQLGGHVDDRMSVMVVAHQEFGRDDEPGRKVKRTMDVRLVQRDGEWVFDQLMSAGGDEVSRPADLSDLAIAVVDHPNIILSDSARWDIYQNVTSTNLLRLMLNLGEQWKYYVVTLTTGHPVNVFGTDTESRHTSGRAVDIFRIGEANIVDSRSDKSAMHDIVAEWCTRDDISSIGSPWRFVNPEPDEPSEDELSEEPAESVVEYKCRSFSDHVHQDHIHISVAN